MQTRAAVMRALQKPLSVEDIELDPPRAGEVRLRMVAAGICGSDRHVLEGVYPSPVPAVAGHEGAGIVEEVGPGVTRLAVGDHVIQTFIGPCGRCGPCRRGMRTFCEERLPPDGTLLDGTFRMHSLDGSDIATTLRLGTFAAHTVTPEINCVAVPNDVDLASAALVSCGVTTGMGASINVAGVKPGDHVLVVGTGGVGVAAIAGAVIAGAAEVIAVDLQESKRDFALEFGATHFINPDVDDVVTAVMEHTHARGVDSVLLTTDRVLPEHFPMAVACLSPGGVVVQVGTPHGDHSSIAVSPYDLLRKQASITGTAFGGMDPGRDALRYIELYRAGRLPLDRFITRRYPLDGINDAFADLAAGRNVRGVVVYD
jgi:S-(hydroxymethyl)glutathione dehydrogenase/alcohol dehydrogenase